MAKFVMDVTVTTHFQFEVEAADQQSAFDRGVDEWRFAPTVGQWEQPGEETEYHIKPVDGPKAV